jgi:hypothetical protein
MTVMVFAIKAEVLDPWAKTFAFSAHKTMYGGKLITEGDTVYVFASENEGDQGLIARGIVTHAEAIARKRGIARQTPRMSVTIRTTVGLRLNSISSFIGKPLIRSSASRVRRRPSLINASKAVKRA